MSILNDIMEIETYDSHGGQNAPCHYVEDADKTIQWLSKPNNMNTVLEYNIWDGNPGPGEEFLKTRKVVLMETDHDAVLTMNTLLNQGDLRALKALLLCESFGRDAVLGFDFKRRRPTVTIYPE